MITPCECGSNMVYVNGTATGPVKVYFMPSGKAGEVDTDKTGYNMSTVVRCVGCDKIRREYFCVDGRIQSALIG